MLVLVAAAAAQQAGSADPAGITAISANVPVARYQTPTSADLYCAGFISKERVPDAKFVNGGLQTPNTTKFTNGEMIYLSGTGYQQGQEFTIVRELRDVNEYEFFAGQHKLISNSGHPYSEVGRVRVLDARGHSAVAEVEFSCDPINPGDVAVPFVEKAPIAFHPPVHLDRFGASSGKLSGRILLARTSTEPSAPAARST